MPEGPLNVAGKSKPDEALLKEILRPANLIIAMTASVLFILFCWYVFVLKPALDANNPMDIRLTKKPFSKMPFPQALALKPETETQLLDTGIAPQIEVIQTEKEPEMVKPDTVKPVAPHSSPRSHFVSKKSPIKTAKAKSAINKKVSSARSQNFQRTDNAHLENKMNENLGSEKAEAENIGVENIVAVEEVVEDEADATEKVKAFAVKWKKSIFVHATQPICTQVQIAMNQCPN